MKTSRILGFCAKCKNECYSLKKSNPSFFDEKNPHPLICCTCFGLPPEQMCYPCVRWRSR